jgi:hypothetical protein
MFIGQTLRTTFSTKKPLTGESMSSAVPPVLTVYRNGVLFAPLVAPVAAVIAVGQYSLVHALTVANGYALFDFVTICAQVDLDGAIMNVPVWEGNIAQSGADLTPLLNNTIYPMVTTHRPSTGDNQNPDGGAGVMTVAVYNTLVLTGLVTVVTPVATGMAVLTIPLTPANGWAVGSEVDVAVTATVDGITSTSWILSCGLIVGSAGGGGTPHHEVIGQVLRLQG